MSTLHYVEEGAGDPLVLLHSGGMAGEEWQRHIPVFAEQFRVVVPDLPGHGNSPMQGDRLTIRGMAEAVLEVLDEVGIERAHVLGSSMGGATALQLTLLAPERVDRLILFRSAYTRDEDLYDGTLDLADPERWQQLGLDGWLSRIHEPQGGPEAWKTVIRRVAEMFDPATTDHVHDLQELASIESPTLIIAGDRDPLVPMEQVLDMYRTIPTAALWILPNATHVTATNTWRRDCFDMEVMRFLRRGG